MTQAPPIHPSAAPKPYASHGSLSWGRLQNACLVLSLATLMPCRAAPPPARDELPAQVRQERQLLQHQAALWQVLEVARRQGFTGEVLVGDARSVWFHEVFGDADVERQRPHQRDQIWRWGSVSKQLAAVLVMQEVEAGRLALGDSLAKLLPKFASIHAGRITLLDLLRHSSGLPNPDDSLPLNDGVPDFYRQRAARGKPLPGAEPSALGSVDAYCSGPPKRSPGQRFEYNNCDTLVLSAVLTRLNQMPYAELVQRRISTPLGLASLSLAGERPHGAAVAWSPAGQPVPQPRLASFGAAGALEGTASDLLGFDRALLSGKLLSAVATRQLWQGDPKFGYAALGAWAFNAPLAGCKSAVRLIERRGEIGGIQVRNVLAPDAGESGLALIVFSNNADLDFGEIWQAKGLSHDLLAAALCP
jgi:D-alanyl-D-alanine carboxypeptidase